MYVCMYVCMDGWMYVGRWVSTLCRNFATYLLSVKRNDR